MKNVFRIIKILQNQTFQKIVLFIGLFFLLAILSLVFSPITKDSPLITGKNQQTSQQVASKSDDILDNQGAIKGINTPTEAVDKSSVNKPDDGRILWQDFIDDRFESDKPSARLASSSDQSNNPTQSIESSVLSPVSAPLPISSSGQNQTSQSSNSSSTENNQSFDKAQDRPTNQSTDFTITNLDPKDKSGFTIGDKISFKINANDSGSTGLLLYKYTIDDQLISDWTDKNTLEWVANGSAPAKHTITIEVRNSKGNIINKTQEFFLYLKPVGFE